MGMDFILSIDGLKEKVIAADGKSISWDTRLQLQKVYERILLKDLSSALAKRHDQDLWTYCYKQCIDALQKLCKDKNSNENDHAAMLAMFLSAASGYLTNFLMRIADSQNLQVPGLNSKRSLGLSGPKKPPTANKASPEEARRMALFCLLHLGDIARYQKQMGVALLYYSHGRSLDPSNGHAYNQLGILAQSRGNRLAAAYHYARAVWVAGPFAPAGTNADALFRLVIEATGPRDAEESAEKSASVTAADNSNLTVSRHTFVARFLYAAALLHNCQDLAVAAGLCRQLADAFYGVLEEGVVKHDGAMHLLGIVIGLLQKTLDGCGEFCGPVSSTTTAQEAMEGLGTDERRGLDILYELFWRFYISLSKYASFLDGHHLKLFLVPLRAGCMWIRAHEVLVFRCLEKDAWLDSYPAILSNFLNVIQDPGELRRPKGFKDALALPEDRDLAEYIPLKPAFAQVEFNPELLSHFDQIQIQKARILRMLSFGIWLADTLEIPDRVKYESQANGKIMFFSRHAAKQLKTTMVTPQTVDEDESRTVLSSGTPQTPSDVNVADKSADSTVKSVMSKIAEPRQTPLSTGNSQQSSLSPSPPPLSQAAKKQSTKLVAINSLLNNKASDGSPAAGSDVKPPQKIKIAPPGSKIELPEPKSNTDEEQEESESTSDPINLTPITTDTSNIPHLPVPETIDPGAGSAGTNGRYELPPRFIAARLKQALSGRARVSSNQQQGMGATEFMNPAMPRQENVRHEPHPLLDPCEQVSRVRPPVNAQHNQQGPPKLPLQRGPTDMPAGQIRPLVLPPHVIPTAGFEPPNPGFPKTPGVRPDQVRFFPAPVANTQMPPPGHMPPPHPELAHFPVHPFQPATAYVPPPMPPNMHPGQPAGMLPVFNHNNYAPHAQQTGIAAPMNKNQLLRAPMTGLAQQTIREGQVIRQFGAGSAPLSQGDFPPLSSPAVSSFSASMIQPSTGGSGQTFQEAPVSSQQQDSLLSQLWQQSQTSKPQHQRLAASFQNPTLSASNPARVQFEHPFAHQPPPTLPPTQSSHSHTPSVLHFPHLTDTIAGGNTGSGVGHHSQHPSLSSSGIPPTSTTNPAFQSAAGALQQSFSRLGINLPGNQAQPAATQPPSLGSSGLHSELATRFPGTEEAGGGRGAEGGYSLFSNPWSTALDKLTENTPEGSTNPDPASLYRFWSTDQQS